MSAASEGGAAAQGAGSPGPTNLSGGPADAEAEVKDPEVKEVQRSDAAGGGDGAGDAGGGAASVAGSGTGQPPPPGALQAPQAKRPSDGSGHDSINAPQVGAKGL
ncbi:hypothetical protein HYH03_000856 [Edaphochlamys debaryana]|uniref:Uncharacterized protein n=1 Tax=Edaphochlamys debaryana TaxID=47281 RepID=A0A835YFZ6_9CHLO|nr:hypothetical protein HYH03_000856 [Edaphochlamys debaryana]|eukprot:KAG2501037.1 hypothetical protein HYH03_000856 [Edaphochlamys debaryana]